jgi:drug/metabolite transporter (DMT)-like permease
MTRRAWAAFAAMSVLWGGSYLLIEIAERGGLPALDVAFLRVAIAAVVLLALAGRAGTLRALRGRGRWLLAYALAEIAIPFPLIATGETHVASSLTAIIIAAVPLWGALLALRFDSEERPTPIRALGLGLGFVGVIALVGLDIAGSAGELLGAGEILLASIGYAAGALAVKHGLSGVDPRAAMGVSLAIATVILAPLAVAQTSSRGWRMPSSGAIVSVVTLGLVCTAAALVIFAVLIQEAGPSRATVITYVNPVVALVLGVSLEGELAGGGLVRAIVGLALILGGSWLATAGAVSLRPRRRVGGA